MDPDEDMTALRFVVAATEDGMVRVDVEDPACADPHCQDPNCDDYVFEGMLTPGGARLMSAALAAAADKAERINPLGTFFDEHPEVG